MRILLAGAVPTDQTQIAVDAELADLESILNGFGDAVETQICSAQPSISSDVPCPMKAHGTLCTSQATATSTRRLAVC